MQTMMICLLQSKFFSGDKQGKINSQFFRFINVNGLVRWSMRVLAQNEITFHN